MTRSKSKGKQAGKNSIVAASLFFCLWFLIPIPVNGAVQDTVISGGNLSLEATSVTVSELLGAIARKAGIDVFIARGCQFGGERRNLKVAGEPIEDVLRSILRGYNYAAVYVKENDNFRISALKIYPEGQQGGEVVPLFSGGRPPVSEEKGGRGETVTVMVSSAGNITTQGQFGRRGLLLPSQSSASESDAEQSDALRTPWFALQAQLEAQEAAKYQELLLMQKKLESTTDPAMKQVLSATYADEMAKYQAVKKANLNKVEALKRITQFKTMTGQ